MDTGVGMEAAAGRDAASGLDTGAGRDADAGRDTGERDVTGVLTQQGYEPCGGADGVIRLRNCPFHQLTEQHREVVCGMNLALVEGLLEGLGADGLQPVLDPRPGHCCVAIGGERA
jgi:predicted ArsR family transcriptional regulator